MLERFRIKTALRSEVIPLRERCDADGLKRAELMFFVPAFQVAPLMKQHRWTAEAAMVFMVTDFVRQAELAGALPALGRTEPAVHAALHEIHARVLARAEGDPALAERISRPAPGAPMPFA